jgi:cell division protein FtsB
MIRSSVVVFIFTVTVSFLCLSYFFGEYGVIEYKRHEQYLESLERNIQDLKNRNEAFEERIAILTSDRESLRVAGRQTGFLGDREYLVRMPGYRNTIGTVPESPGRLLREISTRASLNPIIRAVSVSIGLVVCVIKNAFGTARHGKVRRIRREDSLETEPRG